MVRAAHDLVDCGEEARPYLRLNLAAELLLESNRQIRDIAKSQGISEKYISRLISDQTLRTTDPQIYERARSLWTDIREAGGGES